MSRVYAREDVDAEGGVRPIYRTTALRNRCEHSLASSETVQLRRATKVCRVTLGVLMHKRASCVLKAQNFALVSATPSRAECQLCSVFAGLRGRAQSSSDPESYSYFRSPRGESAMLF